MLFGVINVVTRTAEQVNGAEVGARLSSHGTVEGRATLGTRFENGASLLASISGMNGTGPDLFFPSSIRRKPTTVRPPTPTTRARAASSPGCPRRV
jgi:hypothetical protein